MDSLGWGHLRGKSIRHPLVRYLLQGPEASKSAGLIDLRPLTVGGELVVWAVQKRRRICKDVDEFGAEEAVPAMVFIMKGSKGCQEARLVDRRDFGGRDSCSQRERNSGLRNGRGC